MPFLTFDPVSLADWKARGVLAVRIAFVSKGCAGTKVEVAEQFDVAGLVEESLSPGLRAFFSPEDRAKFSGARLTKVGHKWIFASAEVTSRCGCGSSFSFDSLTPSERRAQQLRERLHEARRRLRPQKEEAPAG